GTRGSRPVVRTRSVLSGAVDLSAQLVRRSRNGQDQVECGVHKRIPGRAAASWSGGIERRAVAVALSSEIRDHAGAIRTRNQRVGRIFVARCPRVTRTFAVGHVGAAVPEGRSQKTPGTISIDPKWSGAS